MGNSKIRIVVVDDSAFMRKALSMMLESDPEIEVVGMARDGQDGVEAVKRLKPDLVTMDVEMPRMDGLTALRIIMEEQPTPVMMVSSITQEGAAATLQALDFGAVDFIPKELSFVSLDIINIKEDLLEKVKNIARRKDVLMRSAKSRARSRKISAEAKAAKKIVGSTTAGHSKSLSTKNTRVIALGCSTGGPPALQSVVTRLPRSLPVPMLVVQHMPPKFTKSLADRLDSLSQVKVSEALHGEVLENGHVYIAPGDSHMTLTPRTSRPTIRLSAEPKESLYRPCVDVMMKSVIERYNKYTLGVILTGMGNDGAVACRELHNMGGNVIAQSEESCVVYGMPKAIVDNKSANIITDIDFMTDEILKFF